MKLETEMTMTKMMMKASHDRRGGTRSSSPRSFSLIPWTGIRSTYLLFVLLVHHPVDD